METTDFFRCRIDAMTDMRHPLAVLATRLPWSAIEVSLEPKFERKDRPGQLIEGQDVLGLTTAVVGGGRSNPGRPQLQPQRLGCVRALERESAMAVLQWPRLRTPPAL